MTPPMIFCILLAGWCALAAAIVWQHEQRIKRLEQLLLDARREHPQVDTLHFKELIKEK